MAMDCITRARAVGQCSKCKTIYPAETSEYFYEHRRRGRIELRAVCKKCWAARVKRYQQGNTYKSYAKEKRQQPGMAEYMRAASRKFHAKPEYREKDRALYRRLAATEEGREKFREKVRRRRARINGATRHHTKEDVQIAMEVQQGRCFYCDIDVSTKYTVDHLIPLVRGGNDGPENIVIACASCNFHKADRTIEEFIAQVKHDRARWRDTRIALGGVALMWGNRRNIKG